VRLSRAPLGLLLCLAAFLLVCCASSPPASSKAKGVASPQPVEAGVPLGGGTPLKQRGSLDSVVDDRKAIESALVLASPSSLSAAFERISSSTALGQDDLRSYAWLAAKIAAIVYPETASLIVPPELRAGDELPATPLAKTVVDAQAGRASDPVASSGALGELLPALALFKSDSRETARKALGALERFESLGQSSVLSSLVRGLDAERRQDWAGAMGSYAAALALAPDAWPASLGTARSLSALGRNPEALKLLDGFSGDEMRDAARDSDAFRRVYAEALYDSGRYEEAEPLVARVLLDDPLDSRFVLIRAHLLIRSGSYQQAVPLLDAYGTVAPSNRLYLLLRARDAEGLKNRDDALRWARRGLDAYPDDPELLVQASRLLFAQAASAREPQRTQESDEGRGYAEKAFALTGAATDTGASASGVGFDAARLLLYDAAARYDWAKAAAYLSRAEAGSLGPEDRALVCLVHRKNGDWAEALELSKVWYRENPGLEAAAEAYARALVGSKQERAAQDLLARLLAGKGSAAFRSALYYLESLLEKGEEASLVRLRSALVENADNGEALTAMFDIYFGRKDYQKARFYLKQALSLSPSDPELLRRDRELQAAS
jgi:tetratricopeptide (TPR) repeat protein